MPVLNFRKKELAQVAIELGLTDEALRACIGPWPPDEANRKLDELRKQVRLRYRALCVQLHPDRNPAAEAAERMKGLTGAWSEIEPFLDALRFAPRPAPPPVQIPVQIRPDGVQIRFVTFPFRTMGTGSDVFGVTATASGAVYWQVF